MDKSVFEQIYDIVARIPEGQVTTYGAIALSVGRPRAPRMVGNAMHRAPEGLPCHRVVNKTGALAHEDAFGGEFFQRYLLENEGVPFLENGRIDMRACFWFPDGA